MAREITDDEQFQAACKSLEPACRAAVRVRMLMKALCGCAAALLLGGCAVLPNTVRVETQHVSHITQHFGPDRTNYGYDSIGVVGRWQFGHAYLEAGDSYSPERVDGYHEVFEARVGYEFQVKP